MNNWHTIEGRTFEQWLRAVDAILQNTDEICGEMSEDELSDLWESRCTPARAAASVIMQGNTYTQSKLSRFRTRLIASGRNRGL